MWVSNGNLSSGPVDSFGVYMNEDCEELGFRFLLCGRIVACFGFNHCKEIKLPFVY